MSRNFELLARASDERELVIPDASRVPRSPAASRSSNAVQSEPREWLRAAAALRRYWRWSLGFAVVVSLLVTTAVMLQDAVYEPTAQVEVDPPGNELFSLDARSPLDSVSYAATQARNLQSDQLAISVIRKLRLDKPYNTASAGPRSAGADSVDPGDPSVSLTLAEQKALKAFRRNLTVQRDPSSWIINVSYAANDPKLAAQITNTTVEQFIDANYRTRHDAIVQSTQWLSHQLDDIRSRMDQAHRTLAAFQRNTGISSAGNAQSTFEERMSELNRHLSVAQADRIQLEAMLSNVVGANSEALPQLKADPVVQDLSKRLAEANTALRQALTAYGRNHPRAKELQAQIDELDVQLKAQQRSIFANLKTSYAAAHTREQLLTSKLQEANTELGKLSEYQALKKQAEANETLYNALFSKIKEAGIAAESKSSNVRWVARAPVLYLPTGPHRFMNIALGVLAGILGGFVLAFVREGIDSRVRTFEDMRSLTGLPGVSVMPVIEDATAKPPRRRLLGELSRDSDNDLFLTKRPGSAEAEALRALFTTIHLSHPDHPPQMLLVASAMPGEGKTIIAKNLSVAFARRYRTCLVDADLRKHRATTIFGLAPRTGLAELLAGSCALREALTPVPGVPDLMLLSSGFARQDAGDLICSDRLAEVLTELRHEFPLVVIDSPPILPYADGRVISSLTDGVIFIGRSGVTTRQAVKRSLELLEHAHSAPVLDVVLNAVNVETWEYRYSYGSHYGKKGE